MKQEKYKGLILMSIFIFLFKIIVTLHDGN